MRKNRAWFSALALLAAMFVGAPATASAQTPTGPDTKACAKAKATLDAALELVVLYNPNVYPDDTVPAVGDLTPALLTQILGDEDLGGGAAAEVEAALAAFAAVEVACTPPDETDEDPTPEPCVVKKGVDAGEEGTLNEEDVCVSNTPGYEDDEVGGPCNPGHGTPGKGPGTVVETGTGERFCAPPGQDGEDGPPGEDGEPGEDGRDGAPGQNRDCGCDDDTDGVNVITPVDLGGNDQVIVVPRGSPNTGGGPA